MKDFLLGICVGIILAINLFDLYTSNVAKRGYISIDNKLYYLSLEEVFNDQKRSK